MNVTSKMAQKLKFLFNEPVKKFVAGAILFFAFLSLSDVSVILFETPSYDQLSISEGKIMIDSLKIRVGTPFNLLINKQKMHFSCAIADSMTDDCLSSERDFRKYQGKIGKVWWFETYTFGWFKGKRLYQLEVDGKLILSYQKQVEKYLRAKEGYFHSNIAALLLLIYGFTKLQFANKSIINRGNTK